VVIPLVIGVLVIGVLLAFFGTVVWIGYRVLIRGDRREGSTDLGPPI
jgi:hypothetical protein